MRILMAAMKLDIGGAETHIVELSKELKRRGDDIYVVSNGGAYVKEIEDAGIKHFKVGLHSKTPGALLRAYHELKKIIVENKIDVVHAHARIPGFLCGILSRRYKFRFVTTAHWVFTTKFPFKLLTNWGSRSLAVSDDIKKYLIDNYKLEADDIRVTINGIDMQKFSNNVDYSDIAQEFGFGEKKTRVVYVSRMDTDRSLAAHKLIEATPKLYSVVPNLEVVVVGGGDDYQNVEIEAEEVNKRLGERVIIVTGPRVDINKFVASGDVFVGVSRAALEAMACEKPAIIAGNEGYIGIFDKDKLEVSIDTNFCCRGCAETTTDTLAEDVLELIKPGMEEKRRELGEYSAKIVEKYYSVKTMADDAVKMYISVIKDSKINDVGMDEYADIEKYMVHGNSKRDIDVMISGYYGFHNSGDDSILAAIISGLKKNCPNINIVVLSKSPEETTRIYGVKSFNRFNFLKIIKELRKTKLLISGGGSLIQDVTSSKSLYYYLAIIRIAAMCGARVMLYANGIGPILKQKNVEMVKKVFKEIDTATLRDGLSAQELERLGIEIDTEITADPVFSMDAEQRENVIQAIRDEGIGEGEKFFIVAVRSFKKNDKKLEEKIAQFAKHVYQKYGYIPVFFPMQISCDLKMSERILELLDIPGIVLGKRYSSRMTLGIVGEAEFVLGMRLHTLIYALRMAVPVIALDYDPKVTAIMNDAEQKYIIDSKDVNLDGLCSFADEIVEKRENICEELSKLAEKSRERAERNTSLAIKTIKE